MESRVVVTHQIFYPYWWNFGSFKETVMCLVKMATKLHDKKSTFKPFYTGKISVKIAQNMQYDSITA